LNDVKAPTGENRADAMGENLPVLLLHVLETLCPLPKIQLSDRCDVEHAKQEEEPAQSLASRREFLEKLVAHLQYGCGKIYMRR
jgi:hypothetical protein